jgi:hypothetical protein
MNELVNENVKLFAALIAAEDALGWILLDPFYLKNHRDKVEAAVTMARKVIDETEEKDGSADLEPVCLQCDLGDKISTMQCYGFDYFCQRCNHGWNEEGSHE